MAGTGSGKTTFLSALINEDLARVARGEASVVIIDSENEALSQHLARNARFGPGGDLHGKLVYLEPDLAHPLKLNIFDFAGYDKLGPNEQAEYMRTVETLTDFFISATVGDTSGQMQNVIAYTLQALSKIPDATIFTFKDLLEKDGFATLAGKHSGLNDLDEDVKDFFADFTKTYSISVNALKTRLDAFTRDSYLRAMFRNPRNGVKLYELLEQPHVIIINTNSKRLGLRATPIFGRFFLAALLDVVQKRQDGGLPAYVYIDEAQKYISQEQAMVSLINEARRQNIAITVAHHDVSDIRSEEIRGAFRNMAVKAQPTEQHSWLVNVRGGPSGDIQPPRVDFKTAPKMSDTEWLAVAADMHERFAYDPKQRAAAPAAPSGGKNISPPPLPDEDATTER